MKYSILVLSFAWLLALMISHSACVKSRGPFNNEFDVCHMELQADYAHDVCYAVGINLPIPCSVALECAIPKKKRK